MRRRGRTGCARTETARSARNPPERQAVSGGGRPPARMLHDGVVVLVFILKSSPLRTAPREAGRRPAAWPEPGCRPARGERRRRISRTKHPPNGGAALLGIAGRRPGLPASAAGQLEDPRRPGKARHLLERPLRRRIPGRRPAAGPRTATTDARRCGAASGVGLDGRPAQDPSTADPPGRRAGRARHGRRTGAWWRSPRPPSGKRRIR